MEETDRQNATDSPKVEVGEMDTRAPFQSVKDADLFGESAFSGEKPAIRFCRAIFDTIFRTCIETYTTDFYFSSCVVVIYLHHYNNAKNVYLYTISDNPVVGYLADLIGSLTQIRIQNDVAVIVLKFIADNAYWYNDVIGK